MQIREGTNKLPIKINVAKNKLDTGIRRQMEKT